MPINTIEEVKELIGHGDCLSPSLRMTKYAFVKTQEEEAEAKKRKDHEFNKRIIDLVCSAKPFLPAGVPVSLAERIPNAESFIMKLGGRLIINQAGGVLENAGLCIHRHFGYPYIPGSALKGLARHAAWWEWSETENPELAKEIANIFGYPTNENRLDDYLSSKDYIESQGRISFLDTIPADSNWLLVTDILTSHHNCDTQNPTPLPFPVVEKGAKFIFSVVGNDSKLRKKALYWLKKALEEDGIGAKTAAGYGWFMEV